MQKYFTIGDVHGRFDMLQALLKYWNPDNEQLLLHGDLGDRGSQSREVMEFAKKLHEEYGAIVLKGNHEDMLLTWLDDPGIHSDWYYGNGGGRTLESFLEEGVIYRRSPDWIANKVKEEFPAMIQFLRNLPLYHEWHQYLFVHAGVNLFVKDWRNSKDTDFMWIREFFLHRPNHTGKIIFFGHTNTNLLNKDESDDIWLSPCKTKVGIDGGAVFGGYLHGVSVSLDEHVTSYSIGQDMAVKRNEFYVGYNHRKHAEVR